MRNLRIFFCSVSDESRAQLDMRWLQAWIFYIKELNLLSHSFIFRHNQITGPWTSSFSLSFPLEKLPIQNEWITTGDFEKGQPAHVESCKISETWLMERQFCRENEGILFTHWTADRCWSQSQRASQTRHMVESFLTISVCSTCRCWIATLAGIKCMTTGCLG